MPLEIERKFLVRDDSWRDGASEGQHFREGLLARMVEGKVRVRRSDNIAWITVKGPRNGISRQEFEYQIPVEHAEEMLATLCEGRIIEKTRYRRAFDGLTWEIDVFQGVLRGLVVCECELERPDQPVTIPPWVEREITGNPEYSSENLVRTVERGWPKFLRIVRKLGQLPAGRVDGEARAGS